MASVQDQMRRAGGGRILLVWPGSKPMFSRKLDVLLLQRHSQAQGAELFLVTRDPDVRYFANEIDIPVFRSLRRAQKAPWQGQAPPLAEEKPVPDLERVRAFQNDLKGIRTAGQKTKTWQRYFALALGVLAFIAVLGVLLPSAHIQLQPSGETQSITLDVVANPQVSNFNLSGALPVQEITVIVEDTLSRPSGGEIGIPQSRATGEVVFTNITDRTVNVPIGTVVRTLGNEPIRFSVVETGELGAEAGASVAVAVEAVNPGLTGNLPANSLISIDGALGLELSVANPAATTGGNDQTSPAPSTQDYTALRSTLMEALIEQAIQETRTDLNEQDIILPVQEDNIEILEEVFDPLDVQPATELDLSLRSSITLQVVRWVDLSALAQAVLDASLPEGSEAAGDSLVIEQVSDPGMNDDRHFNWQIRAERATQASLDSNAVIAIVRGSSPQQVATNLQNSLTLDAPPTINMQPSWWPWLPLVPFRIMVISN